MAVTKGKKTPRVATRSAKERAQDDLVMATNSSSIVSKRSVERIYYPDEPHFFRFFVNKFQRRAPLINRGYYLRLHVIDVAVRQFLERPGDKTKVIVNLGAGSDVLPFQSMTRYPQACQHARFVDIDFPDLMNKKRTIVLQTPELSSMLTGLDTVESGHVRLKSDQYFQIGCDLRELTSIEAALSSFLDVPNCTFLFVAEVSITYMETESADSVIRWASTLGEAEFCLLEQILPDGPDHPFAKTMLSHFQKLKTPIKSVATYPDLKAQFCRFKLLGWSSVDVESLWQVWANDKWFPADKRRELDGIEPFDEWEELALFATHYCVVMAKTSVTNHQAGAFDVVSTNGSDIPLPHSESSFSRYSGTRGQRRFGAALKLRNSLGQEVLGNSLGLGTNNRLRSCDLFAQNASSVETVKMNNAPSSRLCHAVTDLGYFGSFLTGGRTSPTSPLRDCWRFSPETQTWLREDDLPLPLYRHSMTQLGQSNLVLLVGGKTDLSTVFGGCLVHRPGVGWIECRILQGYRPVFGATLATLTGLSLDPNIVDFSTMQMQFAGILLGGIEEDGRIVDQVLRWKLTFPEDETPTISFERLQGLTKSGEMGAESPKGLFNRFGASSVVLDKSRIALVGGVIRDDLLLRNDEVLLLEITRNGISIISRHVLGGQQDASEIPRPLLVGVSIAYIGGQMTVMGGGATCFSMGTYWNAGCYTTIFDTASCDGLPATPRAPMLGWTLAKTLELTEMLHPKTVLQDRDEKATLKDIPRIRVETAAAFEEVVKTGKPVIIEATKLGRCTELWTPEYLAERVGHDRKVVVHEAQHSKMDFNAKNFSYVTMKFGSFLSEAEKGGKLYLRALSEEEPSDQPAKLQTDFLSLAEDFILPAELSFVADNMFSSVLRISGAANMWLHYDVMANVYCQIRGSRRMILFPPSDVGHLRFSPGASSSSLDVFAELGSPTLAQTHPHEAILGPGDILFIPPVWPHTAMPLKDMGIAVNVFFRNLENGYSSGRDVYGNRDVASYEKGRQDVARIASSFSRLPQHMREFYIGRLADELAQKKLD
ncbi:leucine carboxyl methyltransferase [Xylariaceae sp. FL0016]|nr:leucine carboxyl methyltransferase [Xylariaceae sp. FL0016]